MVRFGQPESTGDPDRPAGARSAKAAADPRTSSGHHPRIGQPHDDALEGPIAAAEEAAARISTPTQLLGPPGRPFDWRSPFFIGVAATAGVAVTVGAIWLLSVAAQALLLIALGLFLAVGLEPAVSWFVARGLRRWAAVTSVVVILLALLAGFLAAAIPPLVQQGTHLVDTVPQYVQQINDANSVLGQLNERFQVQQNLEQFLKGSSSGLVSGVLSVGGALVGTFADVIIVLVLTGYFLADLPRIRAA
ncbi:MAG TPA: AI-2E family transporter, partial [Mycobacterium sp.]